jgi:hypothetical protein
MKHYFLFLLFIVASITPINAQVTICYDCEFDGQNQTHNSTGKYNSTNLKLPNNSISSIKVEKGYEVKLFDGDAFNGKNLVVTTSLSCLVDVDFNDITSSMIINKKDYKPELDILSPNAKEIVFRDLSADQYQQKFNEYINKNYRPSVVWANNSLSNHGILYNAQFIRNNENLPFASYHGISKKQFEDYIADYKNKGFALTYVDMDNLNGSLIFCAVFTKISNIEHWSEKHNLTYLDYIQYKAEKLANGYIEYNNSNCMYLGKKLFATSWYKPK